MVNVVGVGVGGSGQQQQLSLSDFLVAPLVLPPAPPAAGAVQQLEQLHKQEPDAPPSGTADSFSNKMTARATLQCRPNSHPFHERSLLLDSPTKIGRSVARSRPCNTNSIFDCKVLSRNHALLWYEDGKFYLQDTKSSNGTFVNNQRLSKGSEESTPREVCSGDIVQFGVDVMENSRKVTHGCIIATLRLLMPDGQEAKASPSLSVSGLPSEAGVEVQQLKACLQEAHYREAAIRTKLQTLTSIIQATQEASNQSWSAMIGEDRLLQKLEMMEAQLATYSKNWPEDRLREEVRRLNEDKCQYESHVKDSLARMLTQKCQAITRLADAERSLANSESELSQLRVVAESSQQQLTELLEQQATQTHHLSTLQQQLVIAENSLKETSDRGAPSTEVEEQLQQLKQQLAAKVAVEEQLQAQVESAAAEADFTAQQLAALQARHGTGNSGAQEQQLADASSGVMASEQRLVATRLKQYQAELRNGQAQLTVVMKDVAVAEKAEDRLRAERHRLEEELSSARCRGESSLALLQHLQHTITSLQGMLLSVPDLVAENNSNNLAKSVSLLSELADIVSNNNDINDSINSAVVEPMTLKDDSSDNLTLKIYDHIYDDYTATITRKKDPSDDDGFMCKKDEPETNKEDKDVSQEKECENVTNEEDDINQKDESIEDDLDTLSEDTTLTIVDTEPPPPTDCVTEQTTALSQLRITDHITSLAVLRDSTRSQGSSAARDVTALTQQLQHTTAAAENAAQEAKELKVSLTTAESYISSRASVVAELQQSTCRLGAAGSIIRQQLQQLSADLLQQRTLVLQERISSRVLHADLQGAEMMAREGVERTEVLSKQLEQLRIQTATLATADCVSAVAATATDAIIGPDKQEAITLQQVLLSQAASESNDVDIASNDVTEEPSDSATTEPSADPAPQAPLAAPAQEQVAGLVGGDTQLEEEQLPTPVVCSEDNEGKEEVPVIAGDGLEGQDEAAAEGGRPCTSSTVIVETAGTSEAESRVVEDTTANSEADSKVAEVTTANSEAMSILATETTAHSEADSKLAAENSANSKEDCEEVAENIVLSDTGDDCSREEDQVSVASNDPSVPEEGVEVSCTVADNNVLVAAVGSSAALSSADGDLAAHSVGATSAAVDAILPGAAGVVAQVGSDAAPSISASDEMRGLQRECEMLRARLAAREEDFSVLSLQNKTLQTPALMPWWAVLMALLVTCFYHALL